MRLHPSGDYDTGGRSGDFSVVRRPDRHMARSQFGSERTLKRSNGWNDVKLVECSGESVESTIVDEVDGQIYNSGRRWQSLPYWLPRRAERYCLAAAQGRNQLEETGSWR